MKKYSYENLHSFNPNIYTIKPNKYVMNKDISINEIFKNLKKNYKLNYYNNNDLNLKNINFSNNILKIRKKIIYKMKDYIIQNKYSISSLYTAIFYMDNILSNEKIIIPAKIEKIGIGCILLSTKYIENYHNVNGIKYFQYSYSNAFYYNNESIRNFEINCLKKLNYDLQKINFINFLEIFLINGIVFNIDKNKIINNKKDLLNIYFFIYKIIDKIIEYNLNYINFNQLYLACAFISFARKLNNLEKWPNYFQILYNISFENFIIEYNFINDIYNNKYEENLSNQNNKHFKNHFSLSKITSNNYIIRKSKYNNNKFIKNSKKLLSKSMEMTRDNTSSNNNINSSFRYLSNRKININNYNKSYLSYNKNINNIKSNKTLAKLNLNNIIRQNKNHSHSKGKRNKIVFSNNNNNNNNYNNKNIFSSYSRDKKDLSNINLSYRTITDSINKNNKNIKEYKSKIKYNKNISSLNSKKERIKNNSTNNNIYNKNNKKKLKLNNNVHSLKFCQLNKINYSLVSKNYIINENNNNNKINKSKKSTINIIDELTSLKLKKIAKLALEQKKRVNNKRKKNSSKNNNISFISNNININNSNSIKNISNNIKKHGRNLSLLLPNKSNTSVFSF